MKKITKFSELKIGQTYLEVSKQFAGAKNRITIVSGDTTDMNRNILYAIFTDRFIGKIPTPQEVKESFKEDNKSRISVRDIFAIWDFEVNSTSEFYQYEKEVSKIKSN